MELLQKVYTLHDRKIIECEVTRIEKINRVEKANYTEAMAKENNAIFIKKIEDSHAGSYYNTETIKYFVSILNSEYQVVEGRFFNSREELISQL